MAVLKPAGRSGQMQGPGLSVTEPRKQSRIFIRFGSTGVSPSYITLLSATTETNI